MSDVGEAWMAHWSNAVCSLWSGCSCLCFIFTYYGTSDISSFWSIQLTNTLFIDYEFEQYMASFNLWISCQRT